MQTIFDARKTAMIEKEAINPLPVRLKLCIKVLVLPSR
jgi:hypothetical protein